MPRLCIVCRTYPVKAYHKGKARTCGNECASIRDRNFPSLKKAQAEYKELHKLDPWFDRFLGVNW